MAVTEAFDLLGISIGDIRPVEDDRFDSVRIVIDRNPKLVADLPEPAFSMAPVFVEFDEPVRLDPKRVGLTWEIPAPVRKGLRPLSPVGALLLHLLPFLLLVTWPTTANEGPSLVPIQLVIQEPPPPPPAPTTAPEAPQPPKPPDPGKLASEDMGDVNPKTTGTAPGATPPAPGEKQPDPREVQTALAVPTPLPPPPKPAPPKEHAPVQLPKPSGVTAPKAPDPPHEAPHAAKYSGPTAARDEYLAYLVTLTRQHLDLLPMSVIGTRRGETIVSVAVQLDGTISHISIARPSAYPDIDKRIAAMVAAVQKFPPVPQWFQGNTLELQLRMRFPDAIEREN